MHDALSAGRHMAGQAMLPHLLFLVLGRITAAYIVYRPRTRCRAAKEWWVLKTAWYTLETGGLPQRPGMQQPPFHTMGTPAQIAQTGLTGSHPCRG